MAPYKYYVLLLVSKPDSYTVLLYAVSLFSFSLMYSPCCIHESFHIAILLVTFFPSVIKWCYIFPLFQNLLLCKVTMSVDLWQTISYHSIIVITNIVPLVSSCKGYDDCNLESWLVAICLMWTHNDCETVYPLFKLHTCLCSWPSAFSRT